MGSQPLVAAAAPQQELAPDFTRRAASPYFCLTTSLISTESDLGRGRLSAVPPSAMKDVDFSPCGGFSSGETSFRLALMFQSPICKFARSVPVRPLCCGCSTRHREIAITPAERRCSLCNAEKSLPAALGPGLRFSTCLDDERESSWEFRVLPGYR